MDEEISYVVLEPFKPIRLEFDKFGYMPQKVTDPVLGWEKTVQTLKFHVVKKNGKVADTVYSVLSVKLRREFEPYLTDGRFKRYAFTIVKEGGPEVTPRIVSAEPI